MSTHWDKIVLVQQHILHQISYLALWRTMYSQTLTSTNWISVINDKIQLFLPTMTIFLISRTWDCFHCITIQMVSCWILITSRRCCPIFFGKHFALSIINIDVQRVRVRNFVTASWFLYLLETFFVAWFWGNMYVLLQTLTNAVKLIPLKWTIAIRMPLALIFRAHTTVPVNLNTSGMV